MSGATFRTIVAGLVFALVLYTNLPAGPIAEAVGKRWDNVAEKIVKVNKAAKVHKPKGKLSKVLRRK